MFTQNLLLFWAAAQTNTIGVHDSPGVPWLRIAVALFFCIGIAIGSILLLRRFSDRRLQQVLGTKLGGIKRISEIEIIETRRASAHGQICLFHYRGMAYLVAVTAGASTLIDKVPIAVDVEDIA